MTQLRFSRGDKQIHLWGWDLYNPWRHTDRFPEEMEDWFGNIAPLAQVHRPVLGEWDDPTWINVEFDEVLFDELRAADLQNRDNNGGRATTRNDGLVYYARGASGLIKIGTSRMPERRSVALKATLLAVESGGYFQERERHAQFREFCVRGEWFLAAPELLDHIGSILAVSA